MKVKELIEILQGFDEELDVLVSGYEGGVKRDFFVEEKAISRDVYKEWWYGEDEIDEKGEDRAVVILRKDHIN